MIISSHPVNFMVMTLQGLQTVDDVGFGNYNNNFLSLKVSETSPYLKQRKRV